MSLPGQVFAETLDKRAFAGSRHSRDANPDGVARRGKTAKGDINILSQAITLVESSKTEHQLVAQEVIKRCLPSSGNSVRGGRGRADIGFRVAGKLLHPGLVSQNTPFGAFAAGS